MKSLLLILKVFDEIYKLIEKKFGLKGAIECVLYKQTDLFTDLIERPSMSEFDYIID
jgi:hypothetical protein